MVNMAFILTVIYFLSFFFLAWKNFRLAAILLIVFLPTYLIRFQLGPLPSTVLELTFGALALVWLVKYSRSDFKNIITAIKKCRLLFVAFGIFFLSSIVSVIISDLFLLSLGLWRAYFLEPMIFFIILVGRMSSPSYQEGAGRVADEGATSAAPLSSPLGKGGMTASDLILGLAFSTLSISVYCIVQKFTGWGIATPEWTAAATRRVTAFFSSPNAVGLYLAPVLMLVMSVIVKKIKQPRDIKFWLLAVTAVLSLVAIIFTKSQGTWIGLAAGLLVFLFCLNYKKVAMAIATLGVVFFLFVPSMQRAILFQDQAGQNRLRLLGYTQIFLSKSPQNFLLGTGLGEFFRKVQKPYYDNRIMERLIFPHSIFVNFWTEIGLLGMLAVIVIIGYNFYLANKIRVNDKIVGAGLVAMLAVLVVHGLVDVPYFKNDLSFLFWLIMALPLYVENFRQS